VTKQLPNEQGVLLEESDSLGERTFRTAAAAEFPELATQLSEIEGVHIAMGVLAAAARRAISDGNLPRAQSIFDFLDRAVGQPGSISEIENATAISFIALAELRESVHGRRALKGMPSRLRSILIDQERRESAAADRLYGR
jgi:hypothetical protein